MSKSPKTPRSVIAAVKDEGQFKAVHLRMQDDVMEVLWAKSVSGEDRTWSEFAVECGLGAESDRHRRTTHENVAAVVGLDSTAVAFYRMTAPAVSDEEIAAIVRMQAESLLPLPPEQIEVAWRATPSVNGTVDVTIAAARNDHLDRFIDYTRDFRPQRIMVSCEGTAQAWRSLFTEQERQAVVVSIGRRHTQVCLVQAGQIVHAAVIDVGETDLSPAGKRGDDTQAVEATERFAQDVRTILDSFGTEVSTVWPIVVLSDGSEPFEHAAACLNAAGLFARTSMPTTFDVKAPPDFDTRDVYEYRTPLGLALLAMQEPSESLDLFADILRDQTETTARRAKYSVVLAGAVAVAMLLALIATSYLVDVGRNKHYKNLLAQTDLAQAGQRQALLKVVAQHRPDVLQLLTDINGVEAAGIVMDSLHFKKGQAVTLAGQADNEQQLWKFQGNLRGRKGLDNVEISNVSQDSKTKKIKFTLTLDFRHFTEKSAVL
jgi:hypothetical protein